MNRVLDKVLDYIESTGHPASASPLSVVLPDSDDLPFLEVAASEGTDALVTGNVKHFKPRRGKHDVRINTPAEFLARLLHSHSRLQPPDELEVLASAARARLIERVSQRYIEFRKHVAARARQRTELGRKHANHSERAVAEMDPAAGDGRIAAVAPLPQRVRQDRLKAPVGPVFLGNKCAAQPHANSERIEVVVVDPHTVDQLGLAVLHNRAGGIPVQREILE